MPSCKQPLYRPTLRFAPPCLFLASLFCLAPGCTVEVPESDGGVDQSLALSCSMDTCSTVPVDPSVGYWRLHAYNTIHGPGSPEHIRRIDEVDETADGGFDLDWGYCSPAECIGNEHFLARALRKFCGGSYRFDVGFENGSADLYVDGSQKNFGQCVPISGCQKVRIDYTHNDQAPNVPSTAAIKVTVTPC